MYLSVSSFHRYIDLAYILTRSVDMAIFILGPHLHIVVALFSFRFHFGSTPWCDMSILVSHKA